MTDKISSCFNKRCSPRFLHLFPGEDPFHWRAIVEAEVQTRLVRLYLTSSCSDSDHSEGGGCWL